MRKAGMGLVDNRSRLMALKTSSKPNNPSRPAGNGVQDLLEESHQANAAKPPVLGLRVTPDKVTVLLDCPDPLANLSNNVLAILKEFERLEIPVYPDAEQLTVILQNISTPGRHLEDQPLVMGQSAVPSQDGRLEWTRDFFSEGWAMDETSGAVDFWQRAEDRAVNEGELVVRLLHPVEGEAGLNVYGNEIPVTKPGKVKLRCGKGMRTEPTDEGVDYYADVSGRVRFADNTVAVDDLYVIKGNVNLETGNIQHTGAVQIMGDVEHGATIEAEGDVLIKGMADPSNIQCGGNLTIAGGLLGAEGFHIHVAGDLVARYINEAHISVDGDVKVTNEISHSRIRCRGKVLVPEGRVAGGMIMGYKGIQVGEAGAGGASETKFVAGVDYTLEDRVAESEERLAKLDDAQKELDWVLKDLKQKGDDKTPEEAETERELKEQSRQLGQAMADEMLAVKRLTEESKQGGNPEVAMFKSVWSGTVIQLGEFKTLVRNSIEKPRIAQLRKTRVRVLPMGEGNRPED
jgi:uncharacterized protein (DUF342 family)